MWRSRLGRSARAGAALLTACGALACSGGSGGEGGSGGSTTSTTTTSGSTSSSDSTTTPCTCATNADCPANDICDGCACVPDPNPCPNCVCVPGTKTPCYEGPPGTEGVGPCKGGKHTCDADGLAWGACEGQVLPQPETCNGVDDDCDALVDPDLDGDGWGVCDGDCCDDPSCAADPAAVNLGALEIPNDGVDNDCDAITPDADPLPTCSPVATVNDPPETISSVDLAKAFDLCHFTSENPPLQEKTWGVISLSITRADGVINVVPKPIQKGVLAKYGSSVVPLRGETMMALSSGTARAEGDPGFVYPQDGIFPGQTGSYDAQTTSALPAEWLAANGGAVPAGCGMCSGPDCATAFDSAALNARIRVPTNTPKLTFWADFYTAEYPEAVCAASNDFFVTLIDGQAPSPDWPADRNVALDMAMSPFSVNSAAFSVCEGCPGSSVQLQGTGMGGWSGALDDGAATGWQKIEATVTPGDTIDLRFVIWDASDHARDSLILLDDFRFEAP